MAVKGGGALEHYDRRQEAIQILIAIQVLMVSGEKETATPEEAAPHDNRRGVTQDSTQA